MQEMPEEHAPEHKNPPMSLTSLSRYQVLVFAMHIATSAKYRVQGPGAGGREGFPWTQGSWPLDPAFTVFPTASYRD